MKGSRVTMPSKVAWVLTVVSTALGVTCASAVEVPVGPRAIAMGGAFSSVASDATALFWNPAGLVRVDNQELSFNYADLFGLGIKDAFGVYALPFSRRSVTAFDIYHSGFDDEELDFNETRFDIGTAYGTERLSGGITGKYVRRQTGLDGASVRDGGGFGLDLGVLARPIKGLSVGLVAQDVFDTKINYPKNETSSQIDRTLRASASYAFGRLGLLAVDVDDQYHAGIEVTPHELIALRAGVREDRDGDGDLISAYGVGFKAGIVQANYAYENHPVLGGTSHFGLSFEYSLNPPLVRIERVDVPGVYSSLYESYATTPFGTASITNLKKESLPVRVRVRLGGLMQTYSVIDTLLRPNQTQDIPLTAVLPDKMLEMTGDRRAEVEIEAEYTSLRVTRKDRSRGRCDVYAPGAINWSRGVDQAGAFVTAEDRVVDEFVRSAIAAAPGAAGGAFRIPSIAKAAAIVDALATLNIAYVEDPTKPYRTASKQEVVDTIRYPRETLRRLSGDCDDTTVLLAALLGNAGVRTQFVDAPGHLFLLFDTGVHANNLGQMGIPDDLLVVADQSVWVPIETTALREGFMKSWRLGSSEYRRYESQNVLHLVDVLTAQSKYTPITEPRSEGKSPSLNGEAVRGRVRADAAAFDSVITNHPQPPVARPDVARLQQAARERFAVGEFEEASVLMLQAVRVYGQSAALRNNLGCVYLKMDQPALAVEQFQQALKLDPGDAGIMLNLGIAMLRAKANESAAMRMLRDGIQRAGGYEKARTILGIPGKVSANMSDPDRAAHQLVRDSLAGGQTGRGSEAPNQALYWREGR